MDGRRGRLIAFEGGEGSGKSTQAVLLAERLGALLTREPGGTKVGASIRSLVLDSGPLTDGAGESVILDPRTEALLMAADRAQHVAEVIGPALASGRDVVTDRFSGSTYAYQGYGRGFDLVELTAISSWASAGIEPDLVLLLDVDPAAAAARRCRPPDRMESAGDDFHRRVMHGYLRLAAADPRRWATVDGSGTVAEVHDQVMKVFEAWEWPVSHE